MEWCICRAFRGKVGICGACWTTWPYSWNPVQSGLAQQIARESIGAFQYRGSPGGMAWAESPSWCPAQSGWLSVPKGHDAMHVQRSNSQEQFA